jgi:hypothetical protein
MEIEMSKKKKPETKVSLTYGLFVNPNFLEAIAALDDNVLPVLVQDKVIDLVEEIAERNKKFEILRKKIVASHASNPDEVKRGENAIFEDSKAEERAEKEFNDLLNLEFTLKTKTPVVLPVKKVEFKKNHWYMLSRFTKLFRT